MNNPKSILIVEDEVILSAWLKMQIENEGYLVCSCITTGEEAIEFVKETKPVAYLTKPVEILNLKPIFESLFNC